MIPLIRGKELVCRTSFLETRPTVIQPTKWLVKKLIPMGHIILTCAKPGHAKSFFAENIAMDVASEDSNFIGLPTRHGKVVLIDEDTPKDDLITRLAAFENGGSKAIHEINYFSQRGLNFKDGSLQKFLDPLLDDATFVVLDTLTLLASGYNVKEQADMTLVFSYLKKITRPDNCIMLLYHAPKDSNVSDLTLDFDKLILGAQAINANCDTQLFTYNPDFGQKRMRTVILRPRGKKKALGFSGLIELRLEEETVFVEDEEIPIKLRFHYVGEVNNALTDNHKTLLAEFERDDAWYVNDIVNNLKGLIGVNAVRDGLNELRLMGRLDLDIQGHGKHKYSVPKMVI